MPEVLHKLAAIIAAEGDLKLVAEQLRESEQELRMLWLEESSKAATYARSFALLCCLRVLGELSTAMTLDIDNVKPPQIKLLQLLLESMGALAPQPVLQQNNQYNFDVNDALNRLSRRRAGKTLTEVLAEDEAGGDA